MVAHLRVKENVEGLVYRSIHYFFYEKQRKHAPLGFSVYVLLQRSVHLLLNNGSVSLLNDDVRVGSASVLSFDVEARTEVAVAIDIMRRICLWSESLLADVAFMFGKNRCQLEQRLAQRISELDGEGVTSFRFRDLYRAISVDARARLHAVWMEERGDVACDADGEGGCKLPVVGPDTSVEDREEMQKFIAAMDEAVEVNSVESKRQVARKIYLQKLWEYVKMVYMDKGCECQGLSNRSLARQLGIPRERIAGLMAELRLCADQCRKKLRPGRATHRPRGSISCGRALGC